MRVCVTGGVGFIGAATVARLLARGDEVVVLDDFDATTGAPRKEANAARLAGPGLRLIRGDVRDPAAARAAVDGAEVVVHLAALGGVRRSIAEPERYASVNVHGTATLLAAMDGAGARRLVFASSSSVYGARDHGPFREDDPLDPPASPYAATKVAGERLIRAWGGGDRHATALRLFTVYGPGQPPGMAVGRFLAAILAGEPVALFGDGSARRDHTAVDDVVDAILAAVDRPLGVETINVGAGHPVRLDALVALLGEVAGRPVTVVHGPAQEGDVPLTWADPARAWDRLGWAPKTGLRDGLAGLVRHA